MKQLLAVVVVVAACVGCGSGTTPVSYCNDFQSEICVRVFECTDPPPPDPTFYGTSVAACQAMLKTMNCATASNTNPCSLGDSFHADKADACVADLKAASCAAFNAGFNSDNCAAVCS